MQQSMESQRIRHEFATEQQQWQFYFFFFCLLIIVILTNTGLPAGDKSAHNAGDLVLTPGLERSPGEGKGTHSSILPEM